jgi:hypothetical protein
LCSIARELDGEKFHRDLAPQSNVLGAVDDTHTAAAEKFEKAIVCDGLARHDTGRRRVRHVLHRGLPEAAELR